MKHQPQPDISQLVQLFGANRFADMEQAARRMLKLQPAHGVLWKALGVALTRQGKDALDAMRRAAQYLPNDAEAHYNLGVESQSRQQNELAETGYRRTLALQPGNVHALNNLGNILKQSGRIAEAEAAYEKALALDPSYPDAYYNLGLTLQDSGRLAAAEKNYRQAIAFRPGYTLAHNNLGLLLARLGRGNEAIASYRAALDIDPRFTDVWINLADLLRQSHAYVDALSAAQHAVDSSSQSAEARVALANVLTEIGETAQGMAQFAQALECKSDVLEAHDNLLFAENYAASDQAPSPLQHRQHAERYGELVAAQARPFCNWAVTDDPERKLRVGLVSGDLYAHPVGYFIENVLQALARDHGERLDIAAYSNTSREDGVSQRIRQHCASWLDVTLLHDLQLAERIHADAVDILIDLSGHTARNRLPVFAWKAAPVQASWLGYFATTGVPAIDYVIADPWTVPEGDAAAFTETVWRLPETRLCFTPPEVAVEVGPLPALRNDRITFGCFNNLGKMGDTVVALWAGILRDVPGSMLFLKSKQLGQAAIAERVRHRFQACGVDPQRLRLEGSSPREQYLAAYNEIDIALDPFPFTGGTTTVEALWMGVPVLTLQGTRMIARQGASLLNNAGLADWIAGSPDAYRQQAVARAADLQALARLRAGLRAQVLASPVFDAARFAGHFAAALRQMWRIRCNK